MNDEQMPEIRKNRVRFIYKGAADRVYIVGDFNNWEKEPLFQLQGDKWIIDKKFPLNARFDYKFLVDGKLILDPLNPNKTEGGFGFNSELRMPRFHYPDAIKYHQDILYGTIKKHTINDTNYFNYKRDVYLYIPYGVEQKRLPLLIFQDGLEYVLFGTAKNTLDYLIYKKEIPAVYALFVDIRRSNRVKEYSFKSRYGNLLISIMEDIAKREKLKFTEKYLSGVSLGGFVSIALLMKYPDVFSGAVSQSGVFRFRKDADFGNLKEKIIYMDNGRYETEVDNSLDIVHLNKVYRKKFVENGANVIYKKWNDGHSWGNWKAHLPKALKALFLSTPNRK